MLSDRETTTDALGFEPYIESLYKTITSAGITPFTIGVYGKWGTGKTSLMKMLQKKLDKKDNIKTVWFNAWKFEKEKDIWIALIQTLLNEIEVKDTSKLEEAKKIIDKLSYGINWIHIISFATSVLLARPDFEVLSQSINFKERIESIYDFEKEFEKLVELSGVDRLVVFIDDLDRCKKDATLHILEAIKLFLYSKKCVYVLGLDHEKICKTIESRFPEDVAEEYLDKIVQLPFFIPRVNYENMCKFLRFLVLSQYMKNEKDMKALVRRVYAFENDKLDSKIHDNNMFILKKRHIEEYHDIIEQQGIIIEENDHNPRKIKKFLNTYFLRRYLKEDLNFKLKNEYVVKFLLVQLKHKNFYKDLERYPNLLEEIQSLSSLDSRERERRMEGSDLLRKYFEDKKLITFLGRMEFGSADTRSYLLLSGKGASSYLDTSEITEDLLSNDSVRISNAIDKFAQLEEVEKRYFIKMVLQDTQETMRSGAVTIMTTIGAQAADPLIDLLERTDSNNLKKNIITVLGEIRDPTALDPLINLLEKTENDNLKVTIVRTLGKLGDIEAVDPLINLLEKTENDN
ncbi:MAG: HEAT repeat domain-containing protein, partial [Theionarchaea archaeon]|nr:HEAT repeat domain-containing protein [Theionarchaea archaeon]